VIDAHRAYVEAGATAIQTNSFLAHLRGADRRRRELRAAALDCAQAAAAASDVHVDVIVTIGPIDDQPRSFWEPIEQALDAGVGAIQCETITTRPVANAFIAAWRDVAAGVADVEVLLGCTTDPADEAGARWIVDLAGDAPDEIRVGLNCCTGPQSVGGLLAAIIEQRGTSWVMPSAGIPMRRDGSGTLEYPFADPDRWASMLLEEAGDLDLAGIGGCCGTTPASISALQRA
jgi:methionine synthase I (cobalamin-dependent)